MSDRRSPSGQQFDRNVERAAVRMRRNQRASRQARANVVAVKRLAPVGRSRGQRIAAIRYAEAFDLEGI